MHLAWGVRMKARLRLDRDFVVGQVDPRLFGSFVEHLGRAVYGGLYDPGHPAADARGFRRDVIELVRELGVPLVRYPGGNFVCSFDWEDSVGPAGERPTRLDLAWRSIEPNSFGLNEFMLWAREASVAPMMALNLGTRGLREAVNLVEYCNHPGGSRWSDLRRSHGFGEPHAIKLWCLGNEMDGPWQVGQKGADEYAALAAETAKALRLIDPSIELVACGSSFAAMPSFPEWEATVLDRCYDSVDYLSLHSYYGNEADDLGEYLAQSVAMESFIDSVTATCDFVKAKKRSTKTMMLSFDEWNVWFHSKADDRHAQPWTVGPRLLEEAYTFEDALVVGCLLIALLKHSDRVRIACLAQLVNAIAPIMTERGGPAWRQTTFYPFLHASAHGRGRVLDLRVNSPSYESASLGPVPFLEATAVENEEGIAIFAVNRSPTEAFELELELGGFKGLEAAEHSVLHHDDPKAVNTAADPFRVVPRRLRELPTEEGGHWGLALPALSWNLVRFVRP